MVGMHLPMAQGDESPGAAIRQLGVFTGAQRSPGNLAICQAQAKCARQRTLMRGRQAQRIASIGWRRTAAVKQLLQMGELQAGLRCKAGIGQTRCVRNNQVHACIVSVLARGY